MFCLVVKKPRICSVSDMLRIVYENACVRNPYRSAGMFCLVVKNPSICSVSDMTRLVRGDPRILQYLVTMLAL
jgi:hypothetical protein